MSFVSINAVPCIITYWYGDACIIIKVYVDDLALVSQSENSLNWLKSKLIQEFNIKNLGKAKTIIGWEIIRDLQEKTLKVDQKKYIKDLFEFKRISSYYATGLPLKVDLSLILDEAGDHLPIYIVVYQHLDGKLIYLACGTSPDKVVVIRQFGCYNSNPQADHIHISKQTPQYFNRTRTLKIV